MLPEQIKQATYYAECGYTVVKVNGKIPVAGWNKAEYLFADQLPEYFKDWKGNFGVVLAETDLVIDIDPRNFKNGETDTHVRLFKTIGSEIKTLGAIASTGGGGVHVYLRLPRGATVRETLPEFPGIEFKSKGRQVVGVSSTHASGKKYEWRGGVALEKISTCPEALIKLISRPKSDLARRPVTINLPVLPVVQDTPAAIQDYITYLQQEAPAAVEGEQGDKTTYTVACKGRNFGLSENKTAELMLGYYNHKCVPEWTPREMRYKVRNAYSYATGVPGSDLVESDFEPVPDNTAHPLFRGWDKTDKGSLQKTLNNVSNYFLISDSPMRDSIAYDEFNGQVRIQRKLPWHVNPLPPNGAEWRDEDSVQLRLWLSRSKQFDVQVQLVDQAVLAAAQLKLLHPVKDYLSALQWDGTPRLDTWLVEYANARDDRFVREASKKFLLQAVSRVYHPGCKADHIIVLEGPQGVGKSSLVEILGGKWYGDIVIDPHSRDTVDAMRGKWFIEFSEMEAVNKHEQQAMKAFITRKVDRVRLAYGRRSVDLPRQCVFMGTMNPDATGEYLNDQTGNRRIWPIKIGRVKFKELADMRDQLFAEAVDMVLKGEATYIIDREIVHLAMSEQKARQSSDPWSAPIAEFLNGLIAGRDFVTTRDVWVYALHGSESQLTLAHQRRIAGCLQELGYKKHLKWDADNKRPVRGFSPVTDDAEEMLK